MDSRLNHDWLGHETKIIRAVRAIGRRSMNVSRRMKMEKSVLKIVRRNCTGMYGGVDNEQRKLLVVFAGPHRLKRFRRSFGAFTVFVWQCLGAVVTLLARWQSPIGGSHFHTTHSYTQTREHRDTANPPSHIMATPSKIFFTMITNIITIKMTN